MNEKEQEATATPQTFNSTVEGLREAAAELTSQRPEPEPLEPTNAADDIPDHVDAGGNNRGLALKDAAEGLAKHRAEIEEEREAFDRAIYGEPEAEGEAAADDGEMPRAEPVESRAPDPVQQEQERNERLGEGMREWSTAQAKLGAVAHLVLSKFEEAFPDVRSTEDVARIAREDPVRFAEFEAHRQSAQEAVNQLAQIQQNQEHAYQQKFNAWAQAEDRLFLEANPDLKDYRVYEATRNKAVELLRGVLQEDALVQAWNSPVLRQHKMQEILLKAARYELAKEAGKTKPKGLPPVAQRPGTRAVASSWAEESIRHADKAMDKSPSVRNAARLLAATRRAQPTRGRI